MIKHTLPDNSEQNSERVDFENYHSQLSAIINICNKMDKVVTFCLGHRGSAGDIKVFWHVISP